jgi:hypothetical protein
VGSYSYVEGSAFALGVSAVQLRVEDFWHLLDIRQKILTVGFSKIAKRSLKD